MLFYPEEMNTFQINVTTDSTMAVTVNLTSSVPESVFLDCRPRAQDGSVVLFMPASSPGPAQTATIECDLSLEADVRERTVNFVLTDDLGESIWESGPIHLKTEQIEDESGDTVPRSRFVHPERQHEIKRRGTVAKLGGERLDCGLAGTSAGSVC